MVVKHLGKITEYATPVAFFRSFGGEDQSGPDGADWCRAAISWSGLSGAGPESPALLVVPCQQIAIGAANDADEHRAI
jgi:hypothetical protein